MRGEDAEAARHAKFREAIAEFNKTLELDSENVDAHYHLQQLYQALGDSEQADHHRQQHLTYKPNDNARGFAVAEARKKYPAANHAAEKVVVYDLHQAVMEVDDEGEVRDDARRRNTLAETPGVE